MDFVVAIGLYAVLWFLTFLVTVPFRLQTQGEGGEVAPGTPSSAPDIHGLGKKARITTLVAAILWALIVGVVFSGLISMHDLDFTGRGEWHLPRTAPEDGRGG